jgi:hypothetical protein
MDDPRVAAWRERPFVEVARADGLTGERRSRYSGGPSSVSRAAGNAPRLRMIG